VPRPATNLSATVIGARDPRALARFYAELLGWEIQREVYHRRPVWPGNATDQQMMMHLDIEVEDLEEASQYAFSLGAVKARYQPQDDVVVCYDPGGHPFCLWVATGE
jgi:catechol 2,3-dioxygenase-like lactoylglutathione lyase family enzyme